MITEDNEDSSDYFSKRKQPELSQSDDSFDTLHNTDSSEHSSDNESSVQKRRSYLDERKSFFDEEDEFLVRKSDGKIYVKDSIWENKKAKHVKKLPYDIDGNTKYEVPYHKIKRFESTKYGRYCGHGSKAEDKDLMVTGFLPLVRVLLTVLMLVAPTLWSLTNQIGYSSLQKETVGAVVNKQK